MRTLATISACSKRSAFTLVELLVSAALIGVIMMVLLTATSASLGLWRGSESRIAVDREGRNALALMTDDLANIVVLPAPAPQPRFGHWDDYVFMEFATARPADYQDPAVSNPGDVCYVRYKYNWDTKRITRSHVDSADTFASFRTGNAPTAGIEEVLADNVTDLSVSMYDSGGVATTDPTQVSTVNISVGVADKQEVENMSVGLFLPESKSTKQYFSFNAFIPQRQ